MTAKTLIYKIITNNQEPVNLRQQIIRVLENNPYSVFFENDGNVLNVYVNAKLNGSSIDNARGRIQAAFIFNGWNF